MRSPDRQRGGRRCGVFWGSSWAWQSLEVVIARGLPNGGPRHVGHQQRAGSAPRGDGLHLLLASGPWWPRPRRDAGIRDWQPPACPGPPGAGLLRELREDGSLTQGPLSVPSPSRSSPVPLAGEGLLSEAGFQWEQGAEGVCKSVSQPPGALRWDQGARHKRAAGSSPPSPRLSRRHPP